MIHNFLIQHWQIIIIFTIAAIMTLYSYPPKFFKEKLIGIPVLDPNIGSIVLHYRLNGCMGQDEELTWIGIIERQASNSNQGMKRYEVRTIGYSDKSLTINEGPLRYIHACQLVHKRNGFQIIFD